MTENYIVAEESSKKSGDRSTRLEEEKKERGKKISFPRWTRENRRETAFLPVKIIYVYVCVCMKFFLEE